MISSSFPVMSTLKVHACDCLWFTSKVHEGIRFTQRTKQSNNPQAKSLHIPMKLFGDKPVSGVLNPRVPSQACHHQQDPTSSAGYKVSRRGQIIALGTQSKLGSCGLALVGACGLRFYFSQTPTFSMQNGQD